MKIKTSFMIELEQMEAIERIKKESNSYTSKGEIIRDAITLFLEIRGDEQAISEFVDQFKEEGK